MSTHRKLHICWWESVSHCTEEARLTFSFVPVLHVILQKKAQTQQAREFHTKSIKEKAVHLSGLFSADSAVLKVTIASVIYDPTLALCFALPAPHSVFICMWTRHILLHAANFFFTLAIIYFYNNNGNTMRESLQSFIVSFG